MTNQPSPSVVAISGSCPTRDNFNSRFNPDYKRWFTCELSTNQSSVISQMSPPVETSFKPRKPMSDYEIWVVTSDLNREFLHEIVELQPQYLLLDFFADVHFGVLRLPDGRYVTNNRWMLYLTDWYQEQSDLGAFTLLLMQEDPEGYFAVWREAMDRFAAHVAEHCPQTIVVVHRGWNTNLVRVPGQAKPVRMRRHKPMIRPFDARLGNELWARLDDYCIERFGWEAIDLRDEGYTSYADHPWGNFWVHYEPEYYHRFIAELHKIHLRHFGFDDGSWDRVKQIEDAARGVGDLQRRHADALADSHAATVARQRERIDELEQLSVGRAVKFAVGQRLRTRKTTDKRGVKP